MKLTKKFGSIFFLSTLCMGTAYAGWENDGESKAYKYVSEGKTIATYLDIPQKPQPTNQTCGATNIVSIIAWETKRAGDTINYSIKSLYKYINTNGSDGLQIPELKAGLKKISDYTESRSNLDLDIDSIFEEPAPSIKLGVNWIFTSLKNNHKPSIIYGNIKGGLAGYHYYLAKGAVKIGDNTRALWLNDSVYNSPAYSSTSSTRKNAINPNQLLSENELETYWKKTGAGTGRNWAFGTYGMLSYGGSSHYK